MRTLSRRSDLPRELTVAGRVPYEGMLSEAVLRTSHGAYVLALALRGRSFECADLAELNQWHERLHALWRQVASPQVALWTHLVRERAAVPAVEPEGTGFADRLAIVYRERLAGQALWTNRWVLSMVYRPVSDPASAWIGRWTARRSREAIEAEMQDALEACEKLRRTVQAGLAEYEPELLTETVSAGGSALLTFLGQLVNGEAQVIRWPRAPVAEVLATTRLIFGHETIEYRMPSRTRLGAVLAIKEYASPTVPGLFNALLCTPYALILTQSFAFLSRSAGQGLLMRQLNRLSNAGDQALSQAEGLKQALDQLSSGEMSLGDHHLSVQVLTDPIEAADGAGLARITRQLGECLADARARLADTGFLVAREDLGLEAAFWAQLPGQFALRPRVAPITTRNFVGMNAFHNFASGAASRGHWGAPIVTFASSAGSPYAFSLHRSDVGHTLLCGPTGSGKTVLMAFLVALYHRRGVRQVLFDKDRGLEVLVRALGGEYFRLRNGEPTGFNPLQLPATPAHIEFLRQWLRILVHPVDPGTGRALSARAEADLDQALRGTLALEEQERRLSRLVEFLDRTDPEGVYARLRRWCGSGEYAWAFDPPHDTRGSLFEGAGPWGFDVTEFLDHPAVRTPITLFLFHLVRQGLDGRPFLCWLDEFWRLIADPAFEQFAKDGPKTWRKLNAALCLATQSVSDVLASPLSHTIVEQTATQIFFPNGQADPMEYREGFGLSARQLELIRTELSVGARQFLVKQGAESAVCRLDLSGLDELIAVLSGSARSLRVLERVLDQFGPDPTQWLSAFQRDAADRGAV